ncbi:hypothetical protein HanIR_Chr11g0558641 [Helianthus annuus]|nr:hypothetical protein HanIR_Chr11g0558641 [Helianthus annuus]
MLGQACYCRNPIQRNKINGGQTVLVFENNSQIPKKTTTNCFLPTVACCCLVISKTTNCTHCFDVDCSNVLQKQSYIYIAFFFLTFAC